ncbi:MAG: prepilin-type N-terminal cleavage/methylation domain-containing protein [Actinomycetota bacterium]
MTRRVRRGRALLEAESGMTLIELTVSVTILGIVMVVLLEAMALSFRTIGNTTRLLAQTSDRPVLSAHLSSDISSANEVWTTQNDSVCVDPDPPSQLVASEFKMRTHRIDPAGEVHASYYVYELNTDSDPAPDEFQLIRILCRSSLTQPLQPGPVSVVARDLLGAETDPKVVVTCDGGFACPRATTLASSITQTDTSFTVADPSALPIEGPFEIRVGEEQMTVAGGWPGATLQVDRPDPADHAAGSPVQAVAPVGQPLSVTVTVPYDSEHPGSYRLTTIRRLPAAANTPTAYLGITITPASGCGASDSPIASDVAAGSVFCYRLMVQNQGPRTATGVIVTTDPLIGVTFLTVGSDPACSVDPMQVVACSLPEIGAGQGVSLPIAVQATPDPPPEGQVVTAAAQVDAIEDDPNTTNNRAVVLTTIRRSADLRISKSAPASVGIGDPFNYEMQVTNNGPSTADNVTVIDVVPGGATFISAGAGCSLEGVNLTCILGTLAPEASVTVPLRVAAPSEPGEMLNLASVTSSDADPNGSDNESTVTTEVTAADLKVQSMTANPDPASQGQALTVTAVVVNLGPDQAAEPTLTLEATNASGLVATTGPSSSPCDAAVLNVVVCTLTPLESEETVSVTLTMTPTGGDVLTTATVAWADDPNGQNDTGDLLTVVNP